MSDLSTAQHYCLVLVSAPSEAEAMAIAQSLVQAKLAACVSLMPIQSVYRWQGQVQTEPEWQLLIKTTQDCFDVLERHVLAIHRYEVPEILAIPIQAGSAMYLRWMDDNVEPPENKPQKKLIFRKTPTSRKVRYISKARRGVEQPGSSSGS